MAILLLVKIYCAGIPLSEEKVPLESIDDFITEAKKRWENGEYIISSCFEKPHVASEICLDVYEIPNNTWRYDLSRAFKP